MEIKVIMQQRYQPTPTNIMHITLDIRCNKAFIKQKSVCMSGACLHCGEVSSQKSGLAPTPQMDDPNTIDEWPSPTPLVDDTFSKIDQH
jgi:hypothetical protein